MRRRVDEDVADRRVGEERLKRAESEQLVAHLLDQALALDRGERRALDVQEVFGEARDLGVELFRLQLAELLQVHPVDDGAVQARLHLLEDLLAVDDLFLARAVAASCERRAGLRHRVFD